MRCSVKSESTQKKDPQIKTQGQVLHILPVHMDFILEDLGLNEFSQRKKTLQLLTSTLWLLLML